MGILWQLWAQLLIGVRGLNFEMLSLVQNLYFSDTSGGANFSWWGWEIFLGGVQNILEGEKICVC